MQRLEIYSLLSAVTGSFFAALREGIIPDTSVRHTLMIIRIIAASIGKIALRFAIPVSKFNMRFIGMHKRYVITMPSNPEANPTITVSALNRPDTSRFEAPIARKIPISLVRSCTEIRVITPIIIDDTTNDIATNAIST